MKTDAEKHRKPAAAKKVNGAASEGKENANGDTPPRRKKPKTKSERPRTKTGLTPEMRRKLDEETRVKSKAINQKIILFNILLLVGVGVYFFMSK